MFKILSNLLTNTYNMSTKKLPRLFLSMSPSNVHLLNSCENENDSKCVLVSISQIPLGQNSKGRSVLKSLVKVSWSLSIMRWKLVKIYKIFRSISHYKSFLLKSSVIFKYLICQIFAWLDCWFIPATAHSHKSEF